MRRLIFLIALFSFVFISTQVFADCGPSNHVIHGQRSLRMIAYLADTSTPKQIMAAVAVVSGEGMSMRVIRPLLRAERFARYHRYGLVRRNLNRAYAAAWREHRRATGAYMDWLNRGCYLPVR